MKRLFIAINLPPHQMRIGAEGTNSNKSSLWCGGLPGKTNCIKCKIQYLIENLKPSFDSNFRWPPSKNWHLTLVFLGNQSDEAIIPILESIKETAKNFSAPVIEFEKIIYGPPNKPPRMIWLTGSKETSKIIGEIKNNLENSLVDGGVRFRIENRPFNSHLTLARFQFIPKNFQLPNSLIPQLPINFTAESIDLMESRLKRTGAEYEVLTEFAL